ncbi:MAG: PDZ domain-containing protein, partial [Phycisphaerales bacterium]|nr:PDZ domain-containing protein [Phycisphaerales bacterium]
ASEAQIAGIERGDIITAVNGKGLRASRTQDASRLTRRIESMPVGETVELSVHRNDQDIAVPVTLEGTPSGTNEADESEAPTLEFTVRDQVYMDGIKNRWDQDLNGMIVTSVENGGWASLAGLANGDLLVSLNDLPVTDTASFEGAIRQIEQDQPAVVKAFVHRGYRTTFVFMEPEWLD